MAIIPDQTMGNPFLPAPGVSPVPGPVPIGQPMAGGGGLAALLHNPQVLQHLLAQFSPGQQQQPQAPILPPMRQLQPPPMAQYNPGFRVPLPAPVNPAAPQLPAGPIGFGRQPGY
jgi:hypothetical protein